MSVNLKSVTVIFPKVFQILIYLYKFKNSIKKNKWQPRPTTQQKLTG